ncbi:MAG TPA: thioredoxin domain-containing protein [Thermoanaerobaculia bacterium]|jgi:hypothetical protein|nr:thioredoxin domain-containing protein [Thermoanaerobaculia bacterium]
MRKINAVTAAIVALVVSRSAAQPEAFHYTNRLAKEKSPYLLQHAHNPVDWYPWGDEAFRKAREENKPIFLSIGYSTCHWCHVMEAESFSDPLVAEMMNATFVSIKVDREERPDIDNVYMTVSQMLTGGGGWPLTIFMTPDKKPFFASTYLPKEDRFGRPGLTSIIPAVAKAWREQRDRIDTSADQIAAALAKSVSASPGGALSRDVVKDAFQRIAGRFDSQRGGLLPAPKFPSPHQYLFLLRYWKRTGDAKALQMVEKTLHEMRRGGIFDQLGYGFHRYSTDAFWLVPHFEKMLYDQAMLTMLYTEAFQATHKAEYRDTAEKILEYVLRDMRSPQGGFYSAEDADSEGKEGKFYVWRDSEIRALLGTDADLFAEAYGVQPNGNYKDPVGEETGGANILHVVKTAAGLENARQKLFSVRERRIHPAKDDKILTDWNGLMIAALAEAAQVFDNREYALAARRAADFLLRDVRTKDGHLLHRYRNGEAAIAAHLDDYAFLTWGLLNLYEATFDISDLTSAIALQNEVIERFWDEKNGGFFLTADDAEALLARPKDLYDGAIPSGNSVELMNLVRLGRMTGNPRYDKLANKLVRAFSPQVEQQPSSATWLLAGVDFALGPSLEVVIAGKRDAPDTRAMMRTLSNAYVPAKVVLFRASDEANPPIAGIAAFTKSQTAIRGKATAYVCTNFNCKLPTNDPMAMTKLLMQH